MATNAFPAYAGMNRPMNCERWAFSCVPRVCGDEPDHHCIMQAGHARSPRMRG